VGRKEKNEGRGKKFRRNKEERKKKVDGRKEGKEKDRKEVRDFSNLPVAVCAVSTSI
jgi:hypothetical protein